MTEFTPKPLAPCHDKKVLERVWKRVRRLIETTEQERFEPAPLQPVPDAIDRWIDDHVNCEVCHPEEIAALARAETLHDDLTAIQRDAALDIASIDDMLADRAPRETAAVTLDATMALYELLRRKDYGAFWFAMRQARMWYEGDQDAAAKDDRMTHTPGPWTVERSDGELWIRGSDTIAYIPPSPISEDEFQLSETDEANARLIAAAPTLLEAAKNVLPLLASPPGGLVAALRAAIALAEGEATNG